MAVVAVVCRDVDAALPTYKLPAPKVRSCHLPGHPGPQARWTASPLNFNPEQLEGQRATFQSAPSSPYGGSGVGGWSGAWNAGFREEGYAGKAHRAAWTIFSAPLGPFPQLEIGGDSTWRPAPSSPRVVNTACPHSWWATRPPAFLEGLKAFPATCRGLACARARCFRDISHTLTSRESTDEASKAGRSEGIHLSGCRKSPQTSLSPLTSRQPHLPHDQGPGPPLQMVMEMGHSPDRWGWVAARISLEQIHFRWWQPQWLQHCPPHLPPTFSPSQL